MELLIILSIIITILVIYKLFSFSPFRDNLISVPFIKNGDLLDPIYNRFKGRFTKDPGGKLSKIDAVYVIAMPDRVKYIKEQIKKLKVSAVYFNAITPKDLSLDDYNNLSKTNVEGYRIYGKLTRLPVLLSFLMCCMDALVKGYNTITIFEDDISILVDNKLINESTAEFNDNNELDVFYMGYCYLTQCDQNTNIYKNLVKLSNPDLLCCHSMCVKTRIMPQLIDYCFPMTTNSDEMFRNFYLKNRTGVCVPKQVYFTQNREEVGSLNQSLDDNELFATCTF